MVKIIADSTCDLSKELLDRYQVEILPLHILLGDEEYEDGRSITPEQIYEWSDANKTTPKTSAPSFETAMELLRPYVETEEEVICFSISSNMSTTVNVMRMAAEELDIDNRVTVIDSSNLSTGIGLLVIEAAVMAQNGKSAAEITAYIEEIKPLVSASFVVDTLTYLYRGGRCSGLTAMVGGALKFHPKIVVEEGKMRPDKKYRGKMSNIVLSYAKEMEEVLKTAKKDRVFITHSGCDDAVIESVRKFLEDLNYFSEIHITRAGCVISSHCGPGTLGVLYIKNK